MKYGQFGAGVWPALCWRKAMSPEISAVSIGGKTVVPVASSSSSPSFQKLFAPPPQPALSQNQSRCIPEPPHSSRRDQREPRPSREQNGTKQLRFCRKHVDWPRSGKLNAPARADRTRAASSRMRGVALPKGHHATHKAHPTPLAPPADAQDRPYSADRDSNIIAKGCAMSWARNLPLSRKFTYAFGVVCALCLGLGVYTFAIFHSIARKSTEVSENRLPRV